MPLSKLFLTQAELSSQVQI